MEQHVARLLCQRLAQRVRVARRGDDTAAAVGVSSARRFARRSRARDATPAHPCLSARVRRRAFCCPHRGLSC
jgi:hypothetical protein